MIFRPRLSPVKGRLHARFLVEILSSSRRPSEQIPVTVVIAIEYSGFLFAGKYLAFFCIGNLHVTTLTLNPGETVMEARINFAKVARGVYEAMLGLEKYLSQCGLEESLLHLIKLRASQINGCAYCLDMHWKDLRAAGETEQRMYGLDAWAESPYYSDRERAALAWTEAVTNIREGHVSDEVYEQVRKFFTEKELADLTFAVAAINGWNRLNIAARTVAGTYRPAKLRAASH